MNSFNGWDIGFSLIVLVSTFIGYSRGFVVDTIATVVLFLALFCGIAFGDTVGELILGLFFELAPNNPWPFWVGLFAIFAVLMVAGNILRNLFADGISEIGMQSADRMIGLVVGLARGFLLVMLLIALMQRTMSDPSSVESSLSFDLLEPFNESMHVFVDFLFGSDQPAV